MFLRSMVCWRWSSVRRPISWKCVRARALPTVAMAGIVSFSIITQIAYEAPGSRYQAHWALYAAPLLSPLVLASAYLGLDSLNGLAGVLSAVWLDSSPSLTRAVIAALEALAISYLVGMVAWLGGAIAIVAIRSVELGASVTAIEWFRLTVNGFINYMCPSIALAVGLPCYLITVQLHFIQVGALNKAIRAISAAHDPMPLAMGSSDGDASFRRLQLETKASVARDYARRVVPASEMSTRLLRSLSVRSAPAQSPNGSVDFGSNESVDGQRETRALSLPEPQSSYYREPESLEDESVFVAVDEAHRGPGSRQVFELCRLINDLRIHLSFTSKRWQLFVTVILASAIALLVYGVGSYAVALRGQAVPIQAFIYFATMPLAIFVILLQPALLNDKCAALAESLVAWDPAIGHSMEERAFLQRYLTTPCYVPAFKIWGWRASKWGLFAITCYKPPTARHSECYVYVWAVASQARRDLCPPDAQQLCRHGARMRSALEGVQSTLCDPFR